MKALVPILGYGGFSAASGVEQRLRSIIHDKGYFPVEVDSGNILSIHMADHRKIAIPFVVVPTDILFPDGYIHDIVKPIVRRFATTVIIEESSVKLPSTLTQSHSQLMLWKKTTVSKILRLAISYCFENLSNPELSLDAIAYNTFISRNTLERLFRKEFGYGVWQFVIQMRAEQAARLLCESDLSIGEIGDAVGYVDRSVFDRVFRSKLGESPKKFRQKVKVL